MAATLPYLVGKVSFFGADHTLAFVGPSIVAADIKGYNARMTDNVDKADASDGNGEIVARAYKNRTHTVTFDVYLVDSATVSLAALKVKLNSFMTLLQPGSLVTAAGFGMVALDGTWNYDGGATFDFVQGEYLKISLPCVRFGDTPAALAVTTA